MYTTEIQELVQGRSTLYRVARNGATLDFMDVLESMKKDPSFRTFFTSLLAESPYAAFRWETPAFSLKTYLRPFEFVLLNEPRFEKRTADSETYRSYFTTDDTNHGIVHFGNISGDAILIVPSPRVAVATYGHLASFVRGAPPVQCDALWRILGETALSKLGQTPRWLSTAGGGVAWLHVRIDAQPKYYGYDPYRRED